MICNHRFLDLQQTSCLRSQNFCNCLARSTYACPLAAFSGSAVISFFRCFLSFIIFFIVAGLLICWTFVFLRCASAFLDLASERCCRALCNRTADICACRNSPSLYQTLQIVVGFICNTFYVYYCSWPKLACLGYLNLWRIWHGPIWHLQQYNDCCMLSQVSDCTVSTALLAPLAVSIFWHPHAWFWKFFAEQDALYFSNHANACSIMLSCRTNGLRPAVPEVQGIFYELEKGCRTNFKLSLMLRH